MDSLFWDVSITGDIKNFVQISIFSNKTKIVEISKEFLVSPELLKHKKGRPHFWIAKNNLWCMVLSWKSKENYQNNKKKKLFLGKIFLRVFFFSLMNVASKFLLNNCLLGQKGF